MTSSTLTTASTDYAAKATPRRSRIDMFIVHHAATTDQAVVRRMFGSRAYQVSANYIVDGASLIAAVPEEQRAWTSGSSSDGGKGAAFDHRAVTVETVNATGAPGWTISEASYRTLAALAADLHRRYGMPLDRDHVVGHRELWERWRSSYPTACPGGIDLDRIVSDARALLAPPPPPATPEPEEADSMFPPTLYINRTSEGLTGLGVAIFHDGRVKGLTRQQWDAWQMLGADAHEVTVGGHWGFLMAEAAEMRAAHATPAPTPTAELVAAIAAELDARITPKQLGAQLSGSENPA